MIQEQILRNKSKSCTIKGSAEATLVGPTQSHVFFFPNVLEFPVEKCQHPIHHHRNLCFGTRTSAECLSIIPLFVGDSFFVLMARIEGRRSGRHRGMEKRIESWQTKKRERSSRASKKLRSTFAASCHVEGEGKEER